MSNTITVVGNLTREPELRFINSGRAVCELGIASNRRYQVNGEWQEEVSYFNLTVWGEYGENCAASFKKGDRVLVSGRLQARQYETKEGEKRTAFDIVVDEIGPSLRWSTVTISRVARTSSDGVVPAVAAKSNHPSDPVFGGEPEAPF